MPEQVVLRPHAGANRLVSILVLAILLPAASAAHTQPMPRVERTRISTSVGYDRSAPLATDALVKALPAQQRRRGAAPSASAMAAPAGEARSEQRQQGPRPPARLVASFDGLGAGFKGPQGEADLHNPSDNSLAVGPNDIVQIVNARMAVFTKKGEKYGETGRVLYGPVKTNNVFRGFGGACQDTDNGDAVVRYDQLAHRWLIVMPIFRHLAPRELAPATLHAGDPARDSMVGRPGQPGAAKVLFQPAAPPPAPDLHGKWVHSKAVAQTGSYAICYAVSTGPDPLGSYYRYEFLRPLFPDYPRPAIWPDGYYVTTSTGDKVIQRHVCVVERAKMLEGKSAQEQCVIVDGVNFMISADLDGNRLPPKGTPEIVIAAGGSQLHGVTQDDGLYVWKFHVDWTNPKRTRLTGPTKLKVTPYAYLCGGQLTQCVPQPGTKQRIDSQGDKIMQRFTYRRFEHHQSLIAVQSVNTASGGGIRWYELRLNRMGDPYVYQQGTYAPDGDYRWMPSAAMDRYGDIGIGYSFGGPDDFVGQRFVGRLAGDPLGKLTLAEKVLVYGQAAQTSTLRWEDYTQTAVDPSDDCTIWYVGDYLRRGDANYSSRIGAFRMGPCDRKAD